VLNCFLRLLFKIAPVVPGAVWNWLGERIQHPCVWAHLKCAECFYGRYCR
jgi:hypothetical protein